jgi:hypothetical protein
MAPAHSIIVAERCALRITVLRFQHVHSEPILTTSRFSAHMARFTKSPMNPALSWGKNTDMSSERSHPGAIASLQSPVNVSRMVLGLVLTWGQHDISTETVAWIESVCRRVGCDTCYRRICVRHDWVRTLK